MFTQIKSVHFIGIGGTGMAAVAAVGEIVGKTTTEDLLDSIFGQFCIGK